MAELNELHDQLQQVMTKLQDIEDNIEQKFCGDETTNSDEDSNQIEATRNPEETDDERTEDENLDYGDEDNEIMNDGYDMDGEDNLERHDYEIESEHDYENDGEYMQ